MGQVIPMQVRRVWSGSDRGAQACRSEVDRRVRRWRWRRKFERALEQRSWLLDVLLVIGAVSFACWALKSGNGSAMVLSIFLVSAAIRRAWRSLP